MKFEFLEWTLTNLLSNKNIKMTIILRNIVVLEFSLAFLDPRMEISCLLKTDLVYPYLWLVRSALFHKPIPELILLSVFIVGMRNQSAPSTMLQSLLK